MSAFGTKQTSMSTLSMSALGGEADMAGPHYLPLFCRHKRRSMCRRSRVHMREAMKLNF